MRTRGHRDGGPGHLRGPHGRSARRPRVHPLSNPSRGPHKPVGAFACSRVTPTASLAFLDESMVGCSWSTTGRTALFLRTRAGHRPRGSGCGPGAFFPGPLDSEAPLLSLALVI